MKGRLAITITVVREASWEVIFELRSKWWKEARHVLTRGRRKEQEQKPWGENKVHTYMDRQKVPLQAGRGGAGGEGGRWTRQIVQACYAILWSCWGISKMYFKVNRRWLEGFFSELSFILFFEYILLIMLLVVPIFPPWPSLYPHPSSTLLPSSSPPLSSCPWVMPISSLASPFSILRFLNIIDFILCAMGLSLALYDYIY